MNPLFLQPQLQLPYSRERWQTLLPQILPGVELFRQPAESPLTNEAQRTIATGLRQIGRAVIRDEQGSERIVAVFEADVARHVNLLRNRVALRQLVARCIDEVSAHAVLAFFVQPGVPAYRLTYAARESVLGADLKVETHETATKRYTYVLGQGETRRTAAQRLAGLAENRDKAKWKDITDAFSVEKLNDEFFKTYKQHYQAFCKHLLDSDAPTSVFHLKLRGLKDKELDKALKPVRDFIKRLLGRLVFLHFLQKKRWLGCPADRTDWTLGDPDFIQTWFAKRSGSGCFYRDFLVPLFYDALNNNDRRQSVFAPTGTRVPYLNGGLFERELVPESGHKPLEVEQLDLPDPLFASLFDFLGQYNFTIDENDPDDHEIGIDPEMLGHVFENLLEDNKDKGAYYTPKAIVQYMCQQSLIHYLQGHFRSSGGTTSVSSADATERVAPTEADAAIERLIRLKEPIDPKAARNWLTIHAHRLEELLDSVKICDPAIGSGAFPIGLLQEIYWTRLTLHPGMDRAKAKRDIIQKSIYGVDIDAGAVEIARLRCWLALIVEEEQPRPLPNLDFKIMQGDSLLESFEGIPLDQLMPSVRPLYEQAVKQKELDLGSVVRDKLQLELTEEDRQRFAKLLGDYFPCEDPAEKSRLHAEIDAFVLKHLDYNVDQFLRREEDELAQLQKDIEEKQKKAKKYELSAREKRRIKALEADIRANRVRKAKLHDLEDKPERPFFLWHLFFQDVFDRGGFDIVIANPPYGAHLDEDEKEGLKKRFDHIVQRIRNTFLYFIGESYELAKDTGIVCLILPNEFLFQIYMTKARRFFLDEACYLFAVNLGESVFDAVVPTCIIAFKKTKLASYRVAMADLRKCKHHELGSCLDPRVFLSSSSDAIRATPNNIFAFNEQSTSLVTKLAAHGTPFEAFCEDVANGISTSCDDVYIVTKEIAESEQFERQHLKQCIRGGQFNRFFTPKETDEFVLYITNDFVPTENPRVYQYLSKHQTLLTKKSVEKKAGKRPWHVLFRSRYEELFTKPKIMIRQTADRIIAASDTANGYYCIDSVNVALPKDVAVPQLNFFVGLLNSSVLNFFYREISQEGGRVLAQVKPQRIRALPIPPASPEQQREIASLVDDVIRTKKNGQEADTSALEKKINNLVYELFALEPSEIALVEDAIKEAKPALDHKSTLFTRILPELSAAAPYFSMEKVAKKMDDLQLAAAEASLKSYMSEAMKKGIVHDAGRGWYSRLATPVTLDPKPVKAVISRIEKAFPLLEFSCWSTEQVNPYMHHLLAKFVTFVYADRDLMPSLFDAMQGWKGYRVYLNPKTADAKSFRLEDNTIVIRPPTSEAPSPLEPHVAAIEQLLVDLAVEIESLPLMSRGEFQDMAWRVATSGRLMIPALLRYARRNHRTPTDVFGESGSTIGTKIGLVPMVD